MYENYIELVLENINPAGRDQSNTQSISRLSNSTGTRHTHTDTHIPTIVSRPSHFTNTTLASHHTAIHPRSVIKTLDIFNNRYILIHIKFPIT